MTSLKEEEVDVSTAYNAANCILKKFMELAERQNALEKRITELEQKQQQQQARGEE